MAPIKPMDAGVHDGACSLVDLDQPLSGTGPLPVVFGHLAATWVLQVTGFPRISSFPQ